MASSFIYRLGQKWNYHTTSNPFEKKVAEINRHEPIISLSDSNFQIKGCPLQFSREHHGFIIDRFNQLEALLNASGKFQIEGSDLFYVVNPIKLRITTSEEIFIAHEIFFERCYYVITPWKYNVIDIGMNVGFASLFFASLPQVQNVYSYEPFRPTFNDALFNFKQNPQVASKITPYNFGLSSTTEKRHLKYSSVQKGKNSTSQDSSGDEVIDLKGAMEEVEKLTGGSSEKFFIKMDCEGAEFEIFSSLQNKPIPSQIFGFIIEWHFKNPQPIIDVLISNQFKVQLRGDTDIGLIVAFR